MLFFDYAAQNKDYLRAMVHRNRDVFHENENKNRTSAPSGLIFHGFPQ